MRRNQSDQGLDHLLAAGVLRRVIGDAFADGREELFDGSGTEAVPAASQAELASRDFVLDDAADLPAAALNIDAGGAWDPGSDPVAEALSELIAAFSADGPLWRDAGEGLVGEVPAAPYMDLVAAFGVSGDAAAAAFDGSGASGSNTTGAVDWARGIGHFAWNDIGEDQGVLREMPDPVATYSADGRAGVGHFVWSGVGEDRIVPVGEADPVASWSDLVRTYGAGTPPLVVDGPRDSLLDGIEPFDSEPAIDVNWATDVSHFNWNGVGEDRSIPYEVQEYAASWSDLVAT